MKAAPLSSVGIIALWLALYPVLFWFIFATPADDMEEVSALILFYGLPIAVPALLSLWLMWCGIRLAFTGGYSWYRAALLLASVALVLLYGLVSFFFMLFFIVGFS